MNYLTSIKLCAKLFKLLSQSLEVLTFQTCAFCRIMIIYKKHRHWGIVYTVKCAYRLSQRRHSVCLLACIFSIHRLERKLRVKGIERKRTKKEGNGKDRLCLLMHLKVTEPYAYHMEYTSAARSKGHFTRGWKKSTSYRTEGHAHSKQYLLQEGKRASHSVLKFLHTSVAACKWLLYICGSCALPFPGSVSLKPLLSSLSLLTR